MKPKDPEFAITIISDGEEFWIDTTNNIDQELCFLMLRDACNSVEEDWKITQKLTQEIETSVKKHILDNKRGSKTKKSKKQMKKKSK